MFRFTESDNYSVPIHQVLINQLNVRGWILNEEIGRGKYKCCFFS